MKISIIGSGLFSMALSSVLTDNGHKVLAWSIIKEEHYSVNNVNIHPFINYSEKLNKNIKISLNIKEVINYSNIIIFAIPSYAYDDILEIVKTTIGKRKYIIINVAKGFHPKKGILIHDYVKNYFSSPNFSFGSLIGPSYASEILSRKITKINLIGKDRKKLKVISTLLNNHYFSVIYNKNEDIIAFSSAYKNIIAVLSGIISGLDYGSNGYAILIVKAIKELKFLLKKIYKINYDITYKLVNYGVIGDLVLTTSSKTSRNFSTGVQIADENSISKILLKIKQNNITVEGLGASLILKKIIKNKKIKLPKDSLIESIIKIVEGKANIKHTINRILIK